ncbi:MAG: DUF4115 domain-containing protein [Acidobacteriia bacterium]|nr:DUF4115 domain-containing protein [Terriglobia bacterium]
MNRRVEQRSQVYTPVKLTLLEQPEQPELDCQLVDVSGAGMRLVADVELPQDQMISLEAEKHVVLGEVRHCFPRGGKFAVGVEKVHVMPAAILDQQPNKAARLQALVDNYRLRINEGIAAIPWEPEMIAARTPEPARALEAFLESPFSQEVVTGEPAETAWEPEMTAGKTVKPTDALEAVLRSASHSEITARGPAEIALEEPSPGTENPSPQVVAAASLPAKPAEDDTDPIRAALGAVPPPAQPVRPRLNVKVVGAVVGAALLAILLIAPFKGRLSSSPKKDVAVEKKLKPEEPKQEREPVSESTPTKSDASKAKPESAKPQTAPVQAPTALAKSAAEPVRSPSQKSAPAVAPAPVRPVVAGGASGKEHASLKFTGSNWASVCADGQKVFERMFSASEAREFTFSDKAVVRLGNAGAVEIEVNGKPAGSAGRPGQLRLLELTAAGLRPLPMGDPADDCAKARVN